MQGYPEVPDDRRSLTRIIIINPSEKSKKKYILSKAYLQIIFTGCIKKICPSRIKLKPTRNL